MKKLHLVLHLILITFVMVSCSSTREKQPVKPVREVPSEKVQSPETAWTKYSKALMHINSGIESLQNKKSADIEFKKALALLHQVEEDGEGKERTSYHIAQCYYYLYNFDEAIKYAKKSISANPEYDDPYMLIYRIYVNLRNYDEAAGTLEKLLKARPGMARVRLNLASLYYSQLKNTDKARHHYQQVLEHAKHESMHSYYTEQSHYYLGHIYYKEDDLKASEYHFTQAHQINPENYSVIYILAALNMETYNLEKAKKYLQMYHNKNPENIKVNSYLGRILYILEDPGDLKYLRTASQSKTMEGYIAKSLYLERLKEGKKSLPILKTVMKKNPSLISPHVAMGRIALRNDQKRSALTNFFTAGVLFNRVGLNQLAQRYLLKALAIDDTIPELFFYLAKSYEESRQYSMAIVHYKKTYHMKPSTDLLLHIGYLYSLDEDYTSAIRYIDMAISKEPENPQHYFFKGLVYSNKKDYVLAEDMMQKAISLNDENGSYYFYLATVQEKQDKLDDTIESLKQAIKYDPESSRAYNYLGYLYADHKINLDESIELITRALELEPENGAYLDSLGWAYFRQEKYREALDKLLEAETQLKKDDEEDPVILDHIGDVYKKLGKTKMAIEYWERSLEIKDDPSIQRKIREAKK